MPSENEMAKIVLDKVVVNIGVGAAGDRLNKAGRVLEMLTNHKPVFTTAKRTVRDFNIRKGLQIGAKVTLRGDDAVDFLKRAFFAKGNKMPHYSFDKQGNAYFGIPDYTDFEGMKYDPDIGIFGLDVAVVLKRKGGYRVSRRKIRQHSIPSRIRIPREDAMKFIEESFEVNILR
ncbi:MAG TPA: 50S ribosomal protein L5 [Thermoplasmataceae archaeon]|nr:50S ribosomal protein L5 [Thermoplasmatales archaeon AK]HLH86006.1 50S ribosomal protein L5 [Thermoplasmataceae archaeon]